jgi:hypothetical protein
VNEALFNGACNLLQNCAGARAGDRVLLVGEKGPETFFDPCLCDDLAEACAILDIESTIVLAKPGTDANHFPIVVSEAMQATDFTIFFSRLGDQIRFLDSPGTSKKIMCYTLDRAHLASAFAHTDYHAMQRMHDHLLARIMQSKTYTIASPNGTSLAAVVTSETDSGQQAVTDFSLQLFPVMIFPPLHFHQLEGQLVLDHFLLSSSTRAYAGSVLPLPSPIKVNIEDSRMIAFDGDRELIARLRSQLERAASITGGDPYRLNSWHTGINPHTFYHGDPNEDLERWGTVAYGSPRYTHIHAAGNDPGDVSIQLFDASISFANDASGQTAGGETWQTLWDNGRFIYLDSDEICALLSDSERELLNSSIRLDIGI